MGSFPETVIDPVVPGELCAETVKTDAKNVRRTEERAGVVPVPR